MQDSSTIVQKGYEQDLPKLLASSEIIWLQRHEFEEFHEQYAKYFPFAEKSMFLLTVIVLDSLKCCCCDVKTHIVRHNVRINGILLISVLQQ